MNWVKGYHGWMRSDICNHSRQNVTTVSGSLEGKAWFIDVRGLGGTHVFAAGVVGTSELKVGVVVT